MNTMNTMNTTTTNTQRPFGNSVSNSNRSNSSSYNNRSNSSSYRNRNRGSSNIPCSKGQDCHFNKQGRCMFFHPQLSQSKQTITKPTFTYHSSDFPALNSVTK